MYKHPVSMGNDDTSPRPRPVSGARAPAGSPGPDRPERLPRLGSGSGELEIGDDDEVGARPSLAHALAALAPRSAPAGCSTDRYEALLEGYRRYVVATTVVAIARGWDSGRITMPISGEPPFAAEVLGIAGWRTGLAIPHLEEAVTVLEEAIHTLGAARAALDAERAPLDVLCAEHGVGTIGRLVLLFVTAPALWGEIARTYGILGNDPGRPTCDEHLLWLLLGPAVSRRDIARALDADSPLVRHGLLRVVGEQRPFQSLKADPIVVKLIGGSSVDADVEHGIARVPATVTLDRFMCQAAPRPALPAPGRSLPPGT